MLCGGQGNISVTANVAPRLMHELCVAAVAGDAKRAMEIQRRLMPVHKHLFVEANPIPREVGDGPHGPVRRRAAPAHDAAVRGATKPWSKPRCAPAACWPELREPNPRGGCT